MFTCRPIEIKTMPQEDRMTRREIAQNWWTKNGTRVKDFLKAYNTLSPTPPIEDIKITELHKSGYEVLTQEAKLLASQVIAYEHVWTDWNKETCDKMYTEGMEIKNALCILDTPVDMAARTGAKPEPAAVAVEAAVAAAVAVVEAPVGGWQREPWGPHLPLNVECILSSSYHTFKDQRWRHLWEEDRYSTLGEDRNKRMDAKIEAEEDAAALTMTEDENILFHLRRAADRKDAAWRSWTREKNDLEQGIGSVARVTALEITWRKMEHEFDLVLIRWRKMRFP